MSYDRVMTSVLLKCIAWFIEAATGRWRILPLYRFVIVHPYMFCFAQGGGESVSIIDMPPELFLR